MHLIRKWLETRERNYDYLFFFPSLIRNPMKSACLYLEGGTHSYQLAASHLVSLEGTLIEFWVFLARGRDCGLIYLLTEMQVSLVTRIILFIQLFLKFHFGERFMSIMYPKVIPSPNTAWQVHKKRNSWEVGHLPYKHCLWDCHIHQVVTAPSPFSAGLWVLAARTPGTWLVCV